jgi:hypothetical protein
MNEEREFLKNYIYNMVNKKEDLIIKYDKKSKDENDSIKSKIEGINKYMNTELPNLYSKIKGRK